MSNETDFYIYAYYYKSTGHIFYIGKGRKGRYKDIVHSRNDYFKSIISKYKEDVDVKKLYVDLTEPESAELERHLISEFRSKGECEANFHEGGFGGNTGNYDKSSESLKKFYAINGPLPSTLANCKKMNDAVRGTHQTEEHKQKLSDSHKAFWENLTEDEYNERIKNNPCKWKPGNKPWNTGKTWSEENKLKIAFGEYHKYEVYLNGILIYWCLGNKRLSKFCKEELGINGTTISKVLKGIWVPKFKRHQHLKTLIIKDVGKSVSTIPDECKEVEWRLQPFEVRDNQK